MDRLSRRSAWSINAPRAVINGAAAAAGPAGLSGGIRASQTWAKSPVSWPFLPASIRMRGLTAGWSIAAAGLARRARPGYGAWASRGRHAGRLHFPGSLVRSRSGPGRGPSRAGQKEVDLSPGRADSGRASQPFLLKSSYVSPFCSCSTSWSLKMPGTFLLLVLFASSSPRLVRLVVVRPQSGRLSLLASSSSSSVRPLRSRRRPLPPRVLFV